MRYHYDKPETYKKTHGRTYYCDHPVYDQCTLYLQKDIGKDIGLAVIQQRYNPDTKNTWWGKIDSWLADDIFEHPKFVEYFAKHAKEPKEIYKLGINVTDKLYPTVTVRQVMWALRMKPLPKQPWETVFDHTPI